MTQNKVSIVLCPPLMRDAKAVYQAIVESVEEIGRWQGWCTHRFSMADATTFCRDSKAFFQSGHEYNYLIFNNEKTHLHGVVSINQILKHHGVANLGYWLRTSSVGQGIMSAAVAQCVDLAFSMHGLQRIEVVMDVNNRKSKAVAERVGAKFEGIARQRLRYKGEPRDAYVFACYV